MKGAHRIPMASGDEHDALTGWRQKLCWKRGAVADIKRRYRRRARTLFDATARMEAQETMRDWREDR